MICELLKGEKNSLLGFKIGHPVKSEKDFLNEINISLTQLFHGHQVDVDGAKFERETESIAYSLSSSIRSISKSQNAADPSEVGALYASVSDLGELVDLTVATQSNAIPHIQWVSQLVHRESQAIMAILGGPAASLDQSASWDSSPESERESPSLLWAQTWFIDDLDLNVSTEKTSDAKAYAQAVTSLANVSRQKTQGQGVKVLTVTLGTLNNSEGQMCLFGMGRLQSI